MWQLKFHSGSWNCFCLGRHLGQSFPLSDSEWRLLPDKDDSGSRPHSFCGLYQVGSRMFPERIRSSPELAGSEETHPVGRACPKCVVPSYWTPETFYLSLYPQFFLRLDWYNQLVILGTFVFFARLLHGCSSHFFLLRTASFRLFPRGAVSYGKRISSLF